MLNLQLIKKNLYELKWFDGTLLQIPLPSQTELTTLISVMSGDNSEAKQIEMVFIFLYNLLNKNKQNKNITMEQFNEKIDLNIAIVILQDYSEFCSKELGK